MRARNWSPVDGVSCRTRMIDFPSLDHAIGEGGGPGGRLEGSDQVPLVNRFGSPPCAEMSHKLTVEQDEFLRRFQTGMGESVDQKLAESQAKARAEFEALWESWKKMNAEQQAEVRSGLHKLGDEAVGEFRGRLENISNSWMVATVTTLNHQSRDVIAQIAATAEERLREASAEVFATFGETLREKLQQIAAGFEKGRGAKAGG